MTKPVIMEMKAVTKRYTSNSSPAVNAVNMTQKQGEILVLLGPSGCGKTTLLRLIAGFEKPEAGTIEIAGQTVVNKNQWIPPEKRHVGMVFQDYALFPHLTVAHNIAFGLRNSGKKPAIEIEKRVAEAIALVRLQGLENRYPHQLSGGQQQRVALARALAPSPSLVLLDEPLSNLDVQIRLKLRQQLREIIKQSGTSAIFVTHDQEEALAISDKIAVMRQGHLEQIGTPEEIYQQPISQFVAEFVTQANFLPAQRRGEFWETELGCFAIDNPIKDSQVELMIPQENFQLNPDEYSPVVIDERIFLGREILYSLLTPTGRKLNARIPASIGLSVGTRVKVSLAESNLKIFPVSK